MKSGLRILYISNARVKGGGEVYLADLMKYLSTNNQQFLLCRPELRSFFKQKYLKILRYWPDLSVSKHHWISRLSDAWQTVSLKRALARARPDIVVVQSFSGDDISKLQDLCQKRAVPTVFTALTLFDPHQRQHYDGSIPMFNRFTAILALCEQTKRNLQTLGVEGPQLPVVHNGIDTKVFKPSTNKQKYVIWVGRVDKVDKNAELFLEIAALADKRKLPLQFRMIGDGPLLASLKAETAKRKLTNLSFCGFLKRSPEIYKDAFALCLTSDSEAMPLCILEAMASGVPVISTPVGGIPEIIQSPTEGRLLKQADAPAFVDSLEELAGSQETWLNLSKAGRKRIEGSFQAGRQYTIVEGVFMELVT